MSKLRVLMLGWEYPPIINGGLGVACKAIADNLLDKVELKVVLPRTNQSLHNERFIGLSTELLKDLKQEAIERSYKTVEGIEFIDIDLFPYETILEERHFTSKVKISDLEDLLEDFEEDELKEITNKEIYGENLALKIVAYAKVVRNYLRLNAFDLIYAHDWMTFLAAIQAKEELGIPFVTHIHSLCYDRSGVQDKSWIFEIEQKALQNSVKNIAVSNYTKEIIESHYSIDPTKNNVIHNGIEELIPKRSEKPFPEKLVLFLGRVTSQKGPEIFLEIAEKVRLKYRNVRFVMAGDGDQLKKVIETGAYRQIGDRFHFTGFLTRDRVNLLFEMTDVYCMPSVSEPFGLSAIEAAQYGIPAVISKQAGAIEVLEHALTANYWETNRFVEHIVDILENDDLASVLSVKIRRDVKETSWESAAEKIVKVFQDAING